MRANLIIALALSLGGCELDESEIRCFQVGKVEQDRIIGLVVEFCKYQADYDSCIRGGSIALNVSHVYQ